MQSIFYHNFSGDSAFTGSLKTKEVHRAITLHPIKHHQHMYRVHNYMQGLKIHELQQRKIGLYRDLRLMENLSKTLPLSDFKNFKNLLSVGVSDDTSPFHKADLFGVPPDLNKYRPRNEEDVFTWDLISRAVYSDTNLNPRRKLESHLKEGLDDVIREVMDNINLFSRERGRVIEFQQILYGYYRLNPLYGPDYILDVLLTFKKYRGRKMTVPVRRHAYIQQQFVDLEIRESVDTIRDTSDSENEVFLVDQKTVQRTPSEEPVRIPIQPDRPTVVFEDQRDSLKKINMIVPLFHKYKAFLRFMHTFEEVCLQTNENVRLFIVMFLDQDTDDENDLSLQRTLNDVNQLNARYGSGHVTLSSVRGTFARAKALNYGMAQLEPHELLFFVDVDMVWTADTLNRVRLNTVAGERVYFPIVFSQFDPAITYRMSVVPNHFLINDETGYWRAFGFGIMSAYKSDIEKVGGFDTSIVGWGREDVDLFEKFITSTNHNVSILRSVDPNLVHIFHIVDCDPSLDLARLNMCRSTRSETYGSVNQLANLVYRYKENVFQYAIAQKQPANKPNR